MIRFILGLRWAPLTVFGAILFAGCGGMYTVGEVDVKPVGDVAPWSDLGQELSRLQEVDGVPSNMWRTRLVLYPCDRPIAFAEEDAACTFDPNKGWISARVCGESAAAWSLAHEWAHRWDWLRGFPVDHSPRWADKERTLKGL